MSADVLTISPDSSPTPDSVLAVISEMNSIGLDGLRSKWSEVEQLDVGLEAIRFGPEPSKDRLHVVELSPFANGLWDHRIVLGDMHHRQLQQATNGDDEVTLTVIASPNGSGSFFVPKEGSIADISDEGIGFFTREVLRSVDRSAPSGLGRLALFGPSQAGAAALAGGSNEGVRKDYNVETIVDLMDPRVDTRSGYDLARAFASSGKEFAKDVADGALQPYQEALDDHSGLSFFAGALRRGHANYHLWQALCSAQVASDLIALQTTMENTVEISAADVLLASGTNDPVSPAFKLQQQAKMGARRLKNSGSVRVISVSNREHTLADNPAINGQLFEIGVIIPMAEAA